MEYFVDLNYSLLLRLLWWRLIGRKQRIAFDTQVKVWTLAEYPHPKAPTNGRKNDD